MLILIYNEKGKMVIVHACCGPIPEDNGIMVQVYKDGSIAGSKSGYSPTVQIILLHYLYNVDLNKSILELPMLYHTIINKFILVVDSVYLYFTPDRIY